MDPPATTARPIYDHGYRPGLARLTCRVLYVYSKVAFRFRLRGGERVPEQTCMLVGNHSAIGIADILTIVGSGHSHFQGRRMVGMMHDVFVHMPIIGFFARSFGAVPANRDAGRAALEAGLDLVTYPGGNLDSCRPFHEHRKVVFGKRRGYIKLALAAGVPIVPVATIGSQYTYLVLPIGDAIARLIRLKRWTRDDRLPITLGAVGLVAVIVAAALGLVSPWWILAAAVWAVLPNPVRITTEFLEPIDVGAATAHIEDPTERIEAAHEMVHGALQSAVRQMNHREPQGG
jgi:1-acyl-sn-glycerol-3-phosphate acyltransferase